VEVRLFLAHAANGLEVTNFMGMGQFPGDQSYEISELGLQVWASSKDIVESVKGFLTCTFHVADRVRYALPASLAWIPWNFEPDEVCIPPGLMVLREPIKIPPRTVFFTTLAFPPPLSEQTWRLSVTKGPMSGWYCVRVLMNGKLTLDII
jgi:hypothetical protein